MRQTLLLTILILISNFLFAQTNNCGCFNGIGSSENDKPSLIVNFSNGQNFSVCGYEQENISETEILISEFNVFDCVSGKPIVEYGALQNCNVKFDDEILTIIELKFLPVGSNWKWINIPMKIQKIYVIENNVKVESTKPFFEKTEIPQDLIDKFFIEIASLKGKGYSDKFETILGKLEILALNGNKKAFEILMNFESYFNFQTDGATAEQLKDAIATIKWIGN